MSAPADGVIPITLNTGPRFQLLAVSHALTAGSLTLSVQVNTGSGYTDMPDFAGISVTTAPGTTDGDGDADDVVPQGSAMALAIASGSGPP